jgi:hypothetical protein
MSPVWMQVYIDTVPVRASHLVLMWYSDDLVRSAQANPCKSPGSRSHATGASDVTPIANVTPVAAAQPTGTDLSTKTTGSAALKDLPQAAQAQVMLWVIDKVVPNVEAGVALWHDRTSLNEDPANEGPEAIIAALTSADLDAQFLALSEEDKMAVSRRLEVPWREDEAVKATNN